MRATAGWKIVMAVACMGFCSSAAAQTVYRCGSHSYSSQPCSRQVVNTKDAPVPVISAEARAREHRRLECARLDPRRAKKRPRDLRC